MFPTLLQLTGLMGGFEFAVCNGLGLDLDLGLSLGLGCGSGWSSSWGWGLLGVWMEWEANGIWDYGGFGEFLDGIGLGYCWAWSGGFTNCFVL